MQRQAWYTWLASTNRPIFGQEKFEYRSFEQLFGATKKMPKADRELTKRICTAHGINILEEPKDA